MSRATPAVEATDLRVVRGSTVALDGLDLCAPAASVTAILGPNGAGKTTLTRAISTLQPYRGSLRLAGVEVARSPAAVRSITAVVSQHTALPPQHTPREYLRLVARLRGLSGREATGSVGALVERFDLVRFADHRLQRCSGGQRRRVALAAALVGDPAVIVLDEPTGALDPQHRQDVWDHLGALRDGGVALILTTQDLDEAARLADHVAILDRGRCRAAGPLDELREAQAIQRLTIRTTTPVQGESLARLARSLDAEVRSVAGQGVLVGTFDLAQVAQTLRRLGVDDDLRELHLQPPSLEEVYRATLDHAGEEAA